MYNSLMTDIIQNAANIKLVHPYQLFNTIVAHDLLLRDPIPHRHIDIYECYCDDITVNEWCSDDNN